MPPPTTTGREHAAESTTAEVPWNEPALPMPDLPSGPPSSRQGDQGPPGADASDEPLIPSPDPSWPRLFEQRQGAPAPTGTEGSGGEVLPESSPDMPSSAGPAIVAEAGVNTPPSRSATPQRAPGTQANSLAEGDEQPGKRFLKSRLATDPKSSTLRLRRLHRRPGVVPDKTTLTSRRQPLKHSPTAVALAPKPRSKRT
jgi:hypothetical protein